MNSFAESFVNSHVKSLVKSNLSVNSLVKSFVPATVETITDNDFEVQDELESVENAGQHSGEPVQTGLEPAEAEYADEIDLAAQYPGRFNATGFEHLQESMADEPLSASNLIASAACEEVGVPENDVRKVLSGTISI